MNCILKSDRHKYSPYSCVQIEVDPFLRPYLCLTIEKTFSVCSTSFGWDMDMVWPIFVVAFDFESPESPGVPGVHWYPGPRTYIQNCTFLQSLRTRRCVLISLSCVRLPVLDRSDRQGALCISQAFRRIRTVHSRRTCRDRGGQVHRRRLWLCHDPVVSFLFLHIFRHRSGAAGQAEILSAAMRADMADVKQISKILIKCEILLCQCLQVGVWCRHTWFESWGLDLFSQTTSQEQICGFWIRASLLDFSLWWSC